MIIDTDAGIDDAEAIIMALTHPDVSVEAIMTVTGNVHRDKVNHNVCTILQQTGQSVPIYSGAENPLIEKWFDDERRYHLGDGLGDWDERPPCDLTLEDELAVIALLRLVNESPGELTLVALGPLTNIALAIRLDPTFPSKLKDFIIMGGAVDAHGNTQTVTAEFNIFIDPEAAHVVLNAMPMTTVVSWETTYENTLTLEQHQFLCEMDTPLANFYAGINEKAMKRIIHRYKGKKLLPDPLAMAIVLKPGLILESETRHMDVELQGQLTRGQTVVNYSHFASGKPNVRIIRKVDMDSVFELYKTMLG